ncbi:U2af50 [Symbiodinium microadriaticum]|nr:U2af50 [Symbiodinium microadriaticum]
MNREKCFAFVELTSIELTSACCQLDGLQFKGNSLRIRRPNDFIPAQMPRDLKPTPVLNLGALGVISTTVTDGPNKVFVGGLPYDLGEEDIKELLMAFGPLKSFHLPKKPSSNLSKGYAFCEYQDPANTNIACEGLNNLPLRDKVLTVRVATQHTTDVLPSHLSASALASIYGPAGVGMAAQGPLSIANTAYAAPDISSEPPTRVLVLKNMVEPHELQDDTELADIREDVTEECSQHGTVRQVMLPRVKDGFPVSAEGSIFVEFETPQMARTAAMALRGRKFADKMVALSYFDEIRFANRELA